MAGIQPLAGLTDAGIAMLAALVLFVVPADLRQRTFLLDWHTAARLPWGLLILFGGGLALAASLSDSGFSEFLAAQAGALQGLPLWMVVAVVTALVVFLTELTSNTATTVCA